MFRVLTLALKALTIETVKKRATMVAPSKSVIVMYCKPMWHVNLKSCASSLKDVNKVNKQLIYKSLYVLTSSSFSVLTPEHLVVMNS